MAPVNPLKLVREGFGDRLARLVDFRFDQRIRDHAARVADHDERITEQEHCTVDHRRRLAALESGLDKVRGDLRWTAGELERLIPHVAAQEAQLEDLRAKIAVTPSADGGQLSEARALIEEVQRQHAQIRVRLTGIAKYEERLARLEEQSSVNAGE
ncbi:hypothetical protein ABZ639_24590 [Saccharomonospora sp. NPDC006951]